jgi:hypothetical protein
VDGGGAPTDLIKNSQAERFLFGFFVSKLAWMRAAPLRGGERQSLLSHNEIPVETVGQLVTRGNPARQF